MAEWKRIDSAPRDGTVIDVWLEYASPEELDFYCVPGTKRSANWHWAEGKFRPYLGLRVLPIFVGPTHWKPLPQPPNDVVQA